MIEGGSAVADLAFTTCGVDGSADAARATLEIAQNGRNALYWNRDAVKSVDSQRVDSERNEVPGKGGR